MKPLEPDTVYVWEETWSIDGFPILGSNLYTFNTSAESLLQASGRAICVLVLGNELFTWYPQSNGDMVIVKHVAIGIAQ